MVLVEGFLEMDFLDEASFILAVLAILTRADFLRATVFFFKSCFFTALSYSDWTLLRFLAVG